MMSLRELAGRSLAISDFVTVGAPKFNQAPYIAWAGPNSFNNNHLRPKKFNNCPRYNLQECASVRSSKTDLYDQIGCQR
jgi:hypothetical protein